MISKSAIAGLASVLTGLAASSSIASSSISDFVPLLEAAPEFNSRADRLFQVTMIESDGKRFEAVYVGLIFKCSKRPQEFFSFAQSDGGAKPQVVSRAHQFSQPEIPADLQRAFNDRRKASKKDAIRRQPKIEPGSSPPFGLKDFLTYEDGWLVAYDVGEFGGGLIWLPKEGDSVIVDPHNTSDLLQIGDTVFAAQGLDHLDLRSGAVRSFERRSGGFPISERKPLKHKIETRWIEKDQYPAGSEVKRLSSGGGILAGVTNYGLVVIRPREDVRYHLPNFEERSRVVQQSEDIFVSEDGRIFVAGTDMIGVYEDINQDFYPKLFIRPDCDPIYEETIDKRK